jgi:hypothetical protein
VWGTSVCSNIIEHMFVCYAARRTEPRSIRAIFWLRVSAEARARLGGVSDLARGVDFPIDVAAREETQGAWWSSAAVTFTSRASPAAISRTALLEAVVSDCPNQPHDQDRNEGQYGGGDG